MKTYNKIKIFFLFTTFFHIYFGAPVNGAAEESQQLGDKWCMRCHGMKTIAYQDQVSGKLVDLFIDKSARSHAAHKKQRCENCHKGDFEEYPHDIDGGKPADSCIDCHKDRPDLLKKYRFDKIAVQVAKSVHIQKKVAGFSCFSCHDMHTWRLPDSSQPTSVLVHDSNQSCINCHKPKDETQSELAAIAATHDWLPAMGLHMEAIRCIECHTPRPGSVVHTIEPARSAEKHCESCHTQDSILLTKLYKYRIQENERKAGFINGVVLNDSYIIGMTRHPILDLLGILMVAGTALGVTVHGLGRWISAKRRRDHEKR